MPSADRDQQLARFGHPLRHALRPTPVGGGDEERAEILRRPGLVERRQVAARPGVFGRLVIGLAKRLVEHPRLKLRRQYVERAELVAGSLQRDSLLALKGL